MPFFAPGEYSYLGTNVKGSREAFAALTDGVSNIGLGNRVLESAIHSEDTIAIGNRVDATEWSFAGVYVGNYLMLPDTIAGVQYANMDNVALGSYIFDHITVGGGGSLTENVGVGFAIMPYLVNAVLNTAVGSYCLGALTSGEGNLALGSNVSSNLASGDGNIAIGYLSGHRNTIALGRNNTIAIGRSAGNDATSDSICIGFNTQTAGFANTVLIGRNAVSGRNNAIILGSSADAAINVGIGTNNPTYKLHVVGSVRGTDIISTNTAALITAEIALANSAGAQAATMLNAPVAGNPTKWISIIDGGVTRRIPTW